jgi:hypothetical protein
VSLQIVPCGLREANAFVARHHRHHGPDRGHKFSIAVAEGERIVGVVIVGRPKARNLQDGFTLEVTRCCTDGTPNACSALYGAAWRAAKAMGYWRLVTFTLDTELGGSLKASGWRLVAQSQGGSWSRPSRPRTDRHPLQGKLRWEKSAQLR